MKPTKRQKQVLDFIRKFIEQHGYSPTYREIKDGLGIASLGSVVQYINDLIQRGLITKTPNSSRSIEITGADERLLKERIKKSYAKATKPEKQIIIKALHLLGYDAIAKDLK